jgi:signal transduction histidine kinase
MLTGLRLREEPLLAAKLTYLEELGTARALFINRLAHSIQGPADTLLSSVDEAVKALKSIQEDVKRLSGAAGEIMVTFSKERIADMMRIKKNRVNLKDFLETLVFANSKLYARDGLTLVLLPVPADWDMWVDDTEMYEVVSNLIRNARRFAREKVEISVEKVEGSGKYTVRVRDDGPGVADSIVSRLFQPGVRVASKRDDETSHGYGLYISSQTLKRHGGTIFLNQQYRQGAEFVVEVPEGAAGRREGE